MAFPNKKGSGWYADWYLPDGRRKRKLCPTKPLAEAWEAQAKLNIMKGDLGIREKKKVTIREFAEKFIRDHASLLAAWPRNGRYTFNELLARWGHLDMTGLKPHDIQAYVTEQLKAGRDGGTINRKLAWLQCMYSKATEWGDFWEINDPNPERCVLNPFKFHKKLPERRRTRLLSVDELRKLLDECSDVLREVIAICALVALRKGEIQRLTAKHKPNRSVIDFNRDVIVILKQKNGKVSEIPIPPLVRDILWNRFVVKQDDDAYNFDWKRSFNTAVRRAGIVDFQYRDIRKTGASALYDLCGKDMFAVKELLRHQDIKTTQIYIVTQSERVRQIVSAPTPYGHLLDTKLKFSEDEKSCTPQPVAV